MTREYAVFLRANRIPSMGQLRSALVELGLTEVDSFGSSGNFVFNTQTSDAALLERRIAAALGSEALLRSRKELSAIVANDPYSGRPGAELFLARSTPDKGNAVFREAFGPEGERPVAFGTTVYFRTPTRLRGRKSTVNFESELGVVGTRRTSRVVARVLAMM